MAFAGFPSRAEGTAVPNVLFSDVLPELADDAAAVGVALYGLRLLMRKRGFPRWITTDELAGDAGLCRFLQRSGATEEGNDAIVRGVRRCVAAGLFLELRRATEGREVALYFLNAPSDRRGMEKVRAEGVAKGHIVPFPATPSRRMGVFALYEQEIGTLTPQIVEQLTEAERLYPAEWFERAFREAAAQNARSWRYVERILERWAVEGPDAAGRENAGDERYFDGKYGKLLRERDRS